MVSDLELAAAHEAAHAVAAHAAGWRVGGLALGPRGSGRTWYRPRAGAGRPALRFYLAGAAGEALLQDLGSLSFSEVETRCGTSFLDFADARVAAFGRGWESLLAHEWRATVALLERRRVALYALAAELAKARTVSGARAIEILRSRWGWR